MDLDVLARKNLLDYLKDETIERNCTILYCTHIFDGLDDWPTHSIFISEGRIQSIREHPLEVSLFHAAMRFLVEARDHTQRENKEPMLVEGFGAEGYSAGRIQPSTQHFISKRFDNYRF